MQCDLISHFNEIFAPPKTELKVYRRKLQVSFKSEFEFLGPLRSSELIQVFTEMNLGCPRVTMTKYHGHYRLFKPFVQLILTLELGFLLRFCAGGQLVSSGAHGQKLTKLTSV